MRYFYSFLQKIEEGINRKNNGNIDVFVFHEIGGNTESVYDISLESFIKVINYCQSNGVIRPLSEIGKNYNTKEFYITFDDIFSFAYENAMRWLEKNRIPFAVFITFNLINKEGYISSEQLRELNSFKYCTIGSHGMNHSVMRKLGNKALFELVESKKQFENELNRKIEYFAFPYGSCFACSKKNINQVRKAGYSHAFSTYGYSISKKILNNKGLFLPRITITDSWIEKEVR